MIITFFSFVLHEAFVSSNVSFAFNFLILASFFNLTLRAKFEPYNIYNKLPSFLYEFRNPWDSTNIVSRTPLYYNSQALAAFLINTLPEF